MGSCRALPPRWRLATVGPRVAPGLRRSYRRRLRAPAFGSTEPCRRSARRSALCPPERRAVPPARVSESYPAGSARWPVVPLDLDEPAIAIQPEHPSVASREENLAIRRATARGHSQASALPRVRDFPLNVGGDGQ